MCLKGVSDDIQWRAGVCCAMNEDSCLDGGGGVLLAAGDLGEGKWNRSVAAAFEKGRDGV